MTERKTTARTARTDETVIPDENIEPVDSSNDEATNEDRIAELERRLAEAEQRQSQSNAEAQVNAPWPPLTTVPEHAAGPGLEVAETWCQADQEVSRLAAG